MFSKPISMNLRRLPKYSRMVGSKLGILPDLMKTDSYTLKVERLVAVIGIPDESKGEALILLTVRDLKLAEIREKLLAVGIPSLWIPKTVKRVEKIPILGSGKLDLGACQALATSK